MACATAEGARSFSGTLAHRAGPALPSYLAWHHAWFSVPPVVPPERWALTPPFHPCQTLRAFRRRLTGFPARCHRAALRRRSILCGTFRSSAAPHPNLVGTPHAEACNSAFRQTLRGKPPGVTRRVALSRVPPTTSRSPKNDARKMTSVPQDGVRTFLPPSHLAMTKPAITRPARHSHYTPDNVRDLSLFRTEIKPRILPMRIREAKDFLVMQTAEQAALEGVPLSDLEKRMMHFTEGKSATEDPLSLNEEFEAEYDTTEYEAKISGLLHHAYKRLRKENDAARRNWDEAVRCLRRGDHYLLVMLDSATEKPRGDSLKLFPASLGIAAPFILGAIIAVKFEPQWRWLQKRIPIPNPHVLFSIFVTIVLAGFFFPRRVGSAMGWLLDQTFFRFLAPKEDE